MNEGFEKLVAWQRGMDLAEAVYSLTKSFPDSERFGLTSQLRRATCSVPSNIAEGYGRVGRNDYLRHLGYARGSVFETKTQLLLAKRVGLPVANEHIALCREVIMILTKLIDSLQPQNVRGDQADYGLAEPLTPEP